MQVEKAAIGKIVAGILQAWMIFIFSDRRLISPELIPIIGPTLQQDAIAMQGKHTGSEEWHNTALMSEQIGDLYQ
jgi:hypothetical protein